jgi:hypothetical protein
VSVSIDAALPAEDLSSTLKCSVTAGCDFSYPGIATAIVRGAAGRSFNRISASGSRRISTAAFQGRPAIAETANASVSRIGSWSFPA